MTRIRSVPEITEEGTRALVRALGYPDAVRFLTAFRPGKGDYTKERRKLLKSISLDEILTSASRRAPKKKSSSKRKSA